MSGKPFRSISYCSITQESSVDILKPYVDSDKNSLFRTYGLSTGVDIAAEGYVFAAIFGSVVDINDEGKNSIIITLQYDADQIIRYCGLYEVFVRVGDSVMPWMSVGSVHNQLHVEYATTWKKNARWSIKVMKRNWYKQDPMPFVDGSLEQMGSRNIMNYHAPANLGDEYSSSKMRLISDVATAVMKYSKSYGFTLNSPIIAQALVESEWGKASMTSTNNCYFIRLKDQGKFSSCDDCVNHYFIYMSQQVFSRMKGMIDTSAFIDSFVDCGYYPQGSKYPGLIKDTLQRWNLTQFDGISSDMSHPAQLNDVDRRNAMAYMKDNYPGQLGEVYDNW